MTGLDFFVEVVVTGAVRGVGVDSSAEAVARTLGDDFAEDRGRGWLRRDYGLVEFSWSRRSGGEDWEPAGFTVQAHRLASAERPDQVAGDLARRYGESNAGCRSPSWMPNCAGWDTSSPTSAGKATRNGGTGSPTRVPS